MMPGNIRIAGAKARLERFLETNWFMLVSSLTVMKNRKEDQGLLNMGVSGGVGEAFAVQAVIKKTSREETGFWMFMFLSLRRANLQIEVAINAEDD